MKNVEIILLLVFSFRFFVLTGQASGGIYKSASDFIQNRVFHASGKNGMRLHELIRKDHVDLRHGDSSYCFKKQDVYGYCDKAGNTFRFFDADIYPVVNRGETILLYKVTAGTGLKNSPLTETWFFSKDAAAPILPLKITCVLSAFAADTAFTRLLELYCKAESDLRTYDPEHRQYKLNRLLDLSTACKNK